MKLKRKIKDRYDHISLHKYVLKFHKIKRLKHFSLKSIRLLKFVTKNLAKYLVMIIDQW